MLNKKLKLKNKSNFSLRKALVFTLIFAGIGSYVVWRTFASNPPIASLQVEQMKLPAGAEIITDNSASGGQVVKLTSNDSLTGSVTLPSNATSFTIKAWGSKCRGSWPKLNTSLDGAMVLSGTINSSSWHTYTVTKNISAGSHTLSLTPDMFKTKNCATDIYLDVIAFYGQTPVVQLPTLSFSATPTSVTTGGAATLTWTSTNTTSCTATGSWSGSKPLTGSLSTGALNATVTYNLTCTGAGGNVAASVNVAVTNPSPPATGLPKQGFSPGYKILTRSAADRRQELDKMQRALNGHPGYVRLDSTPGNQAQLDAVVSDVLARGLTPMLILYGTTGPRATDTFGHDQAIKWLGKVSFFEITNEPDLHGWTPDGYADFVKATSTSIKSGNSNAVVIAGALWKGSSAYKTQDYARSLATRAKGSFQMLSLHLYDDPKTRASWNIWDMAFPSLFGATSYYKGNTCREILDANGLTATPIISTETGGPITTYGEDGQNTIITHDFDAVDSNLLPSIAVYSMKNDDVPGFGLLRDDNSERPAFTTYMNRAR